MTKPAARIEEVNAFRDLSDASRTLLASMTAPLLVAH